MRAVEIEFRGKSYTVASHRAFALGDVIETIAPLPTVIGWRSNPPFRKLAQCYGAVLRFAGVEVEGRPVSDEEVLGDILVEVKSVLATGVAPQGIFYQQIIEQLVAVLLDGMPEMPADVAAVPAKKKRGL